MDTSGILPREKVSGDLEKSSVLDVDYISHFMDGVLATVPPVLVDEVHTELKILQKHLEALAADTESRIVAMDIALKSTDEHVSNLEAELIIRRTTRMKELGTFSIMGILTRMEYIFYCKDSRYHKKVGEAKKAERKVSPARKWRIALEVYPDRLERPLATAGFKRKEVLSAIKTLYKICEQPEGQQQTLTLGRPAATPTDAPRIEEFVHTLCNYMMVEHLPLFA